ncbi:MAG: hypothetical protein ACLU99_07380 [Alphaproteobacteria bacterium]
MGVNRPTDNNWVKLFNNEIDIDEMVRMGESILSWIKVRNARLVRSMALRANITG